MSLAPLQAATIDRIALAPPTRCVGLEGTGLTGWNVSTRIGPMWAASPQFLEPSRARTWNQCSLSGSVDVINVVVSSRP